MSEFLHLTKGFAEGGYYLNIEKIQMAVVTQTGGMKIFFSKTTT